MTSELKAALFASLLTGIFSLLSIFINSKLTDNQTRQLILLHSKKDSLEKIYMNILESEKICKANINNLNLINIEKINKLNLNNQVLVDMYLPYFKKIHKEKKDLDKLIYSLYGNLQKSKELNVKTLDKELKSIFNEICTKNNRINKLYKIFILKEKDEIITGAFTP